MKRSHAIACSVFGLFVFASVAMIPGAAAQETLTPEKERAIKRLEEMGFIQNYSIDGADMVREAEKGNLEVVKLFLAAGIDPNTQTASGQRAIFAATEKGRVQVVEALLKAGASMDVKDEVGRTPLVLAVQRDQVEVAQLLLQRSEEL